MVKTPLINISAPHLSKKFANFDDPFKNWWMAKEKNCGEKLCGKRPKWRECRSFGHEIMAIHLVAHSSSFSKCLTSMTKSNRLVCCMKAELSSLQIGSSNYLSTGRKKMWEKWKTISKLILRQSNTFPQRVFEIIRYKMLRSSRYSSVLNVISSETQQYHQLTLIYIKRKR